MRARIGIDVGGTFTDFVLVDGAGRLFEAKVVSTPGDPARSIGEGLEALAAQLPAPLAELLASVDLVVHGSTVALNALIEQRGARTALLTTAGFRDSLEIRLAWKEKRYDWRYPPPPVLVPRHLRLPIRERITKEGEVHTPLVEEDVHAAAREIRRLGVESIAVCFLWSFRNPAHERRVGEILAAELPGVYVSLSVDVLPEIREYDRTSTTVVNAYVGPILRRYVEAIETYFAALGYRGAVRYQQSNAGIASGAEIVKKAVCALGSGPAAAPPAGLFHSRRFAQDDILTVDMGGTSCDVCLVRRGQPDLAKGVDVHRYRIGVPMIDVNTVGAGGGSIAFVDEGGILHVGPRSAGARPGPAGYGLGGVEPTVTDADIVLGYVDASRTLGGRIGLRPDLARRAVHERVAAPLALADEVAALAIFKIVNNNMARAIHEVSVERGYDPRDFALYVAGGCGPVHAWMLAREIGVERVFVPRVAPAFCAFGEVVSDVRHDYSRSVAGRMDTIDPARLGRLFAEMEEEGSRALGAEGIAPARVEVTRRYDIRYVGQIYECVVTTPRGPLTAQSLREIVERFHGVHQSLYAYAERDNLCELINVGVSVTGKLAPVDLAERRAEGGGPPAPIGARPVYFEERGGTVDSPVYAGDRLRPGQVIDGPAVVEEKATSIVAFPGTRLRLDGATYVLAAV
ncbi:MAG: hydantoinase/oxoprolinase family protein [Deltaproteobacteria bacterium]|nr:hydantoinase/oxoprolinase family protein [Deltaproteobacteria bacterium]